MTAKAGQTEALALNLARGLNQTDAALAAGVSARTARRRMEEPGFRGRVRELRSDMFGRTVGVLAEDSSAAVKTLRELLDCDSPAARLGAARAILDHAFRARESCELEERLADLERAIERKGA